MNKRKSSLVTPSKQIADNKPINTSEDIPVEIASVIRDLPREKQLALIKFYSHQRDHSGPLPDGETIRIYAEVIPNGGDRLMKNVEIQSAHRIEIEKIGVTRSYNQSSTGQWMGFVIAILFGCICWDLARAGMTVTASIIGTVDLVALVTVFITGRKK